MVEAQKSWAGVQHTLEEKGVEKKTKRMERRNENLSLTLRGEDHCHIISYHSTHKQEITTPQSFLFLDSLQEIMDNTTVSAK